MVGRSVDGRTVRLREPHDLSFLARWGRVFRVLDDQDSGNLCFGVSGAQGKLFVKYAGAETVRYSGDPVDAIKRARQAVRVYRALEHPTPYGCAKPSSSITIRADRRLDRRGARWPTIRTVAPLRQLFLAELGSGTYAAQVMRTRYIDDVVAALVEGGTTQVVILGAGLDTRAFRLPVLARADVAELDLSATQQYKRERLRGFPVLARTLRFVPTDLTRQPIGAALDEAGIDGAEPVLFVWEGVTQYLPEASVLSTPAGIGESAPGSSLVFTHVRRAVIDGSVGDGWLDGQRTPQVASEPWLFGMEPEQGSAVLAGRGLSLVDDVDADELRSRYVEPLGRQLEINAVEHAALAVVRRP
jgi:methyltransferase (TIGR00027 family)